MQAALVVDDDRDVRETVTEILEDQGFSVHCARDGREALDWLRTHPTQTQVVVLDMVMPVMNGEDFLRAKEADPTMAGVPVVVVTAQRCHSLARHHSVKDCLPKPIRFDKLLAALHRQL